MRSRRKAREAALQALYQCDTLHDWSTAIIDLYFTIFYPESVNTTEAQYKENLAFAQMLIHGAIEQIDFIDGQIAAASANWSIARMPRVDRNILRVATFELGFLRDIPTSVAINEAIEIAKRYGTDDSPMFINGVLDKIAALFKKNPEIILQAEAKRKVAANE